MGIQVKSKIEKIVKKINITRMLEDLLLERKRKEREIKELQKFE